MGTDKFNIPSSKAGVIIGPGGQQIKDIKDKTNAHITVTEDPDDSSKRLVIIIGEQSARDDARDMINTLLAASDRVDAGHLITGGGSAIAGELTAGPGGMNDGVSRDQSPAPMTGDQALATQSAGYGAMSAGPVGPQGAVQQVAGGNLMSLANGQVRREMQVPHSVVGLVIGRGGETIRRLQQETGASIKFPPCTQYIL